jgi:iron only hydrogenase large subunit-like protein
LRNCYVKSISFNQGKSEIIPEDCIYCGKCITICPQKAKDYVRDYHRLNGYVGHPFLVSLAPSFFAHFDEPFKIIALLKSIGAVAVQETAVGADIVSYDYAKYTKRQKKPVISTACPVVVDLAEKYFPNANAFLAPFLSPMAAHSRFLKSHFGNFPTFFIGPCIAKKKEGESFYDLILTFEEIDEYIRDEKIEISGLEESFPTPPFPKRGRMYPISGGINDTIDGNWHHYSVIEGIENVAKLFKSLDSVDETYFFEVAACPNGCIDGTAIRKDLSFLEKRSRIIRYTDTLKELKGSTIDPSLLKLDITRNFISRYRKIDVSEEEIRKVLVSIGKKETKEELNCSACGYTTCREKAAAVVIGKAEREMCVSYMIERITSASTLVAEETPNVVVIHKNNKLIFLNKAGKSFFDKIDKTNEEILDMITSLETSEQSLLELEEFNNVFFVKAFDLPDDNGKVVILTDLTKEKQQEERLRDLKRETFSKIDVVLDKQMRLAQEIASLLGESIAETKSHFVEFKRFMEGKG